jgi:hypothetical protein
MSRNSRIDVAIVISPLEAPDGTLVRPTGAILSHLPPGAVPSAGFPCCAGEWLLYDGDLDDLTVSVWCGYARRFRPRVKATYDRSNGAVLSHKATPFEARSGNRPAGGPAIPGRVIPLDLSAALSSIRAGDRIYDVTVTGVPVGARLSAGIENGGGSWTLLPDHLGDTSLMLPRGFAGAVTLAYCVISVGPGGRLHSHNAHADLWVDTGAEAGISFGPGRGRMHFAGNGGARDIVHLVGIEHGPSDEITGFRDWKLVLDDLLMAAKPNGNGLRFKPEASGSIMLGDGNELSFDGVTSIDW